MIVSFKYGIMQFLKVLMNRIFIGIILPGFFFFFLRFYLLFEETDSIRYSESTSWDEMEKQASAEQEA